jgi:hypothetical protein
VVQFGCPPEPEFFCAAKVTWVKPKGIGGEREASLKFVMAKPIWPLGGRT